VSKRVRWSERLPLRGVKTYCPFSGRFINTFHFALPIVQSYKPGPLTPFFNGQQSLDFSL